MLVQGGVRLHPDSLAALGGAERGAGRGLGGPWVYVAAALAVALALAML